MSIVNDKKSIITEISVLNSIGKTAELPDQNFTYPSINNKNEPIPFMLDLLTATIGSEALQRTTGQIMTQFIRGVEPELKSSLKTQSTTFNSDQEMPAEFVNNGYEVPVKKIDLFNKLKTDPSSSNGSLLYGDNANNFDKAVYSALLTPGSVVPFGNVNLEYSEATDNLNVKPIGSPNIGTFTNGFIDNITIINEKEFTTTVMDAIYGTMSHATKKPLKAIVEEEKVKNLISKLMESDAIASITDAELTSLQELAKNKYNGVAPVDVGCSIVDGVLDPNDIAAIIANNTGNTDPLSVGGAYNAAMESSFGRVPGQINPQNKNAIRDGFFKRLIKTILDAIVYALTSTPQIRVLLMIVNGFKNNDDVTFPASSTDDMNSQKNFINCISKSAGGILNEYIFNLLKIELQKLLIPVLSIIVKEKIQSYLKVLESLVI